MFSPPSTTRSTLRTSSSAPCSALNQAVLLGAPRRTRIAVTRTVEAIAADPANPKATLWNPAGAPFEAACERAGAHGINGYNAAEAVLRTL